MLFLIGRRSDQDLSRPWTVELAEENGLPCPENGPALFNEDDLRRPEKGGLDVGGGVSLRMPVTVGQRDDPIQGGKDVPLNVGSAFSLIVTAAVVWGTKRRQIPFLIPISRIAAATRSVMSIISHRAVVWMVNNVIPASFEPRLPYRPSRRWGFPWVHFISAVSSS